MIRGERSWWFVPVVHRDEQRVMESRGISSLNEVY